jgi:outer membrane receptor protein involved in Fe transport
MSYSKNDLRGVLALLVGGALLVPSALAQEAEPSTDEPISVAAQNEESPQVLDRVVTTGTRIKGLAEDGAVQAFSIDRGDIVETGAGSLIEVLKDLPVTGGGRGTFSTSTAGALSGDTPPGAASVSLRGLGASSTLTLINGRRASITAFAQGQENFIDVNAIPLAAIERVDVLPNGASAIYGADAVAGVVNYILRDDFNGFEVQGSYGNSTAETDEGKLNLNAVWGRSDDRQSILLVADYYKRNALFDRDRDFTANSVRPSQQGFFPSFNDLFLMFNDQTEEPQDGGCAADDFFDDGAFGDFCQVNTNAFVATDDALESIGIMGAYKLRVTDDLTWFNDLLWSTNESNGTSSPANFSRAPVNPENPFFPQSLIDDIVEEANIDNPGTIYDDFFGFPIFAWGKIPEPRAVTVESETLRLTSGLTYEADNGWTYEAALVYGQNESTQRGLSGLYRTAEFEDALLGNLCSDGSRVDALAGDRCEDTGLVTLWYNPFGGQTQQDQAVLDAIVTQAERNGESSLLQFDVSASGDVFMFNGRQVKGAFGAEVRREELTDTPSGDAVATTDNPDPIVGFSSTSADADRTQWAAFGELYIPLSDNFDIQLAGRFDDDSDFGSDFNPKIAFRYAPADQLVLRGNWSTSFRAPSLAQTGAGVRLTSFRVDCEITPEACDGDSTADGESLLSEEIGNPNLKAEEAESWSLGFVFEPSRNFNLSVDYWNIRHEDLVGIDEDDFIRRALAGEFTVIDIADGTLETGTPGLEVDRGFVTDAHIPLTNLGFQETSGLDVSATQYFDLGTRGELAILADAAYLFEFERQASADAEIIDEAGEFTYPELTASARLRWTTGPWRASLRGRYVSSYKDDPSPRVLAAAITNGLVSAGYEDVDDWLTFDASVSYDYGENSFIQLSIDNLFDEDPPLALGTGANVDHFNHSSLGRFITLRVGHAF